MARPQLTSSIGPEIAEVRTGSSSHFLGFVHFCYAILGLVLYQDAGTTAVRMLRGAPTLEPGESEISNTVGQLILLCGLFVFLWRYRSPLIRAFRPLLPVLVLLALCFVSAAWSGYPSITIRRSTSMAICTFFGIYCYFQFGFTKTIEMLAKTSAVLAVLSLAVYFLLPSMGRDTAEGYHDAMRGIYSQKNTIGMAMLIASNYWLFALLGGRKVGFLGLLGAGATFACLVLSMSGTSLVIFSGLFLLHLINYARRSWRLRLVVVYGVGTIVFVLAVALISAPAELLGLFGRDLSFTGRVPLWIETIEAIKAKPILGYGFSAFWIGDSIIVQSIWRDIAWPAPNAHNGYLDVLLQFGVVGLFVYLWMWLRVILGALRAAKRGVPAMQWLFGFIMIALVMNLDEGGQPAAGEFALLLPVIILGLANVSREPIRVRRGRALRETDLVGAGTE